MSDISLNQNEPIKTKETFERKLKSPEQLKARFKELSSPEPFSRLRKTPARIKYMDRLLKEGDEELNKSPKTMSLSATKRSKKVDYTPLRASNINQLRGNQDISTPAANSVTGRMTRLRAKKLTTELPQ